MRTFTRPSAMADRFTAAVDTGVRLIGQFNDRSAADPATTAALFAALVVGLDGLPPDDGYRANAVAACRTAYPTDPLAARYQMTLLVRRLRADRDGWARVVTCS